MKAEYFLKKNDKKLRKKDRKRTKQEEAIARSTPGNSSDYLEVEDPTEKTATGVETRR